MQSDAPDGIRDPLVGQTIGRYRIVRLLAEGGMGQVYEGVVSALGKPVAVKLLSEAFAKNREACARFEREARAASSVDSPYIVDVFDAGATDEGRPYLVMELMRGASLATTLANEGPLAPAEAVRLATHVLRGLERAHAAGVVHRDLKPDNVFLVDHRPEPPVAKVLDFGVSKVTSDAAETTLTREGSVIGTPAYMSPEQAQGDSDIDCQTDLWSVGAILYECIANKRPFPGSTYEQIIVRICSSEPVSLATLAPSCPASIVSVVERCLTRDRSKRFRSASEVLEALGQGSSVASLAPPAGDAPRSAARARDAATIGSASTIEAAETSGAARWSPRRIAAGLVVAGVCAVLAWAAFARTSTPPTFDTVTPASSAAPPLAPTGPATEQAISTGTAQASPPIASAPSGPPEPPATAASPPKTAGESRPRPNLAPTHTASAAPVAPPSARAPGIAGDLPLQTH